MAVKNFGQEDPIPCHDCLYSLNEESTHLNLDSFVVINPTSSSEGLKSMDRTLARHEIAVCFEKKHEQNQI